MKTVCLRNLFFLFLYSFSNFVFASYEVFPVKEKLFVRSESSPALESVSFEKHPYAENYTIRLYNGGVYGEFEKVEYSSVSSARVFLNDTLLFAPSDFNKNVTFLEKNISVNEVNTLSVELASKLGSALAIDIVGIVENEPPQITSSPILSVNEFEGYAYQVLVSDDVGDTHEYSLLSHPAGMDVSTSGLVTWSPVDTDIGTHSISIEVVDNHGFSTEQSFSLEVLNVNEAPVITSQPTSSVSVGSVYVYQLVAEDADGDELIYSKSNAPDSASIDSSTGEFYWQPTELDVGSVEITLSVNDSNGGLIHQSFTLNVISSNGDIVLPPEPSEIATDIKLSEISTFFERYAFLFNAAQPVQVSIQPGVIEESQIAIIKGQVLDNQNMPLSGVKISILHGNQFGWTYSREDGYFDISVNGGGNITLEYTADEHFKVQRTLATEKQSFTYAPDVVMTKADSIVTTVTAGVNELQTITSSSITDDAGTRTATIFYPANTSALMVLENGVEQVLTELNVRATEYTVGDNGPQAMPGTLPATSAYTYAVELSIDEAIEAGATTVEFSQALPVYVNNFLDFPVGEAVPAGWYDSEKAAWIPSNNGRVIQILSVDDNGLAVLDVTGNGEATPTELAALNIDTEELIAIAQNLSIGESFWRVPVTHFTPWDYNWPYGPPEDAESPPRPEQDLSEVEPEDSDIECGSIIDVQNRVLGEQIGVAGTDLSLNYRTDGVEGYKLKNTIEIKVTEDSIPSSLQYIDLEVFVAGQKFTKRFSPGTNISYKYVWNGKDAYGRQVSGQHKAYVNLSYAYLPVYYESYGEFDQSFSLASGTRLAVGTGRDVIKVQRGWNKMLGAFYNKGFGLGGWRISEHHALDPDNGRLFLGNCTHQNVSKLVNVVDVYGGFATSWYPPKEDDYVSNIKMIWARQMHFDNAGNLFYLDKAYAQQNALFKINPEGYVTRVAGTIKSGGSLEDGVLAVDAKLESVIDFVVSNNGEIFIADRSTETIKKVDTSGYIHTVLSDYYVISLTLNSANELIFSANNKIYVLNNNGEVNHIAGTGKIENSGEPALALEANLNSPRNFQFDNQGELYFSTNYGRIKRLSNSGLIETMIGNDASSYSNIQVGILLEDIPLLSGLGFFRIDNAGNIFLYDWNTYKLYKVGVDGVISHIFGSGMWELNSGNGGSAQEAGSEGVLSIAINDKGEVFTGEHYGIRKIFSNNQSIRADEIYIPSSSGGLIYTFDTNGRHQTTLNAQNLVPIYSFGYDENGLLTQITDISNRVTELVRDGENLTSIISPYGLETSLNYDGQGYLSEVINPLSDKNTMDYSFDGLLESFSDLNGNKSYFAYDSLGALVKDTGPTGSFTHLSKQDVLNEFGEIVPNASAVKVTTAEGIEKNMIVETNAFNERQLTRINPDGSKNIRVTKSNGDLVNTSETGVVQTIKHSPDPRFKEKAPYASHISTILPSGLTSIKEITKTVTLSDPDDYLSATKFTMTEKNNGNVSSSVYDVANRSFKTMSAEGRVTTAWLDSKGRVTEVNVPNVADVIYTYDELGKLREVTQTFESESRVSTLGYDSYGYLNSITNAIGNITTINNDLLGRNQQTTQISSQSDDKFIDYSRDGIGNILGITLPMGDEHTMAYNAVNDESLYVSPDIGLPNHSTQRFYDLNNRLTGIVYPSSEALVFNYSELSGHLSTINTPQGDISFNYNDAGQINFIEAANEQQLTYEYDGLLMLSESWLNGTQGTISREYNNHFLVNTVSVNDEAISYVYDKDNLLVQAGDMSIERDVLNGRLDSTTIANITSGYAYNGFSEVTNFNASNSTNSLFNVDYIRDSIGRISSLTETINGQATTFDYIYDDFGQLIEVKKGGVVIESNEFDLNGNRTLHNGMVATYDAQDRLLTRGAAIYTYDANGALTSITENGQTSQYQYDLAGNLLQAKLNNKTIDYSVDGKDRRVAKAVDGIVQQRFIYQDQLNPIAELDKDNNVVSRFIYADKAHVPSYMEKAGKTYRIISDHLGSVRLVVDVNDGTIAQQLNYDTNGNVLLDTNSEFQPFGYAGGIYDVDTGLVRFGARDYDPVVARWTSKDPIRFDGGINLYGYVNNDPVNRIDPLGLGPCDPNDDDCVQQCLAINYGESYRAASKLSLLSLPSYVASEFASEVADRAKAEGNRKLNGGDINAKQSRHSEFKSGKAIAKGASQLVRFNAGMTVVGAFATGFQVGALGYCNISCAFD